MKINARSLKGVSETLLFTLYMRYRESLRPDGKISDKRYAQLVEKLDFDHSLFDEVPEDMQLSLACRSVIFDTLTRGHIARHPGTVVVSLGPGLDFRHERLDTASVLWIDIDLPEVMELRKAFFPDTDRHRSLGASVLDISWMRGIPRDRPVLFIAEGLFVYLLPRQVRSILAGMASGFARAELILDVYSNWHIHAARNSSPYTFLRKMYGMWKWGMDHWGEIEAFHPGIVFIEEYYVYHGFGDRMPEALREALSEDGQYSEIEREVIRTMSRIGHFRFGGR